MYLFVVIDVFILAVYKPRWLFYMRVSYEAHLSIPNNEITFSEEHQLRLGRSSHMKR